METLVPESTDEQIIGSVLAGDTDAFEAVMRRYNRRLYRISRAILKDDAEAEDVLQETWVRAYSHLAEFAGRSKFATWLTRIAVYGSLARMRKRRRFEDLNWALQPASDRGAEASTLDREMRDLLERTFDELPDIYRAVFMLRDVEQLSTSEAAACLGIPEDTVRTRLHRARAILRRTLTERAGDSVRSLFAFDGARCDRAVARVLTRVNARKAGR